MTVEGLAVRQLSRLGNELYLTSSIAASRLVPGHYDRGVILILLLRMCADDWIDGDAFRRPERAVRGMSVHAMAISLGRPYATVHRIVAHLKAAGRVVETEAGIALSNDPAAAASIVALMIVAHDSLIRLVEDLRGPMRLSACPSQQPTTGLRRATLLAALDIWLVPFEYAPKPVTDWTSKLVWIVIAVANVRHVTVDPLLSDRFAFDPTPDRLRLPIATRRISAVAGVPYGTVFRHCHALAAQDVLRHDEGGWLLVSRQLFHADVDAGVHALIAYFRKRIIELIGRGLDPWDAAAGYIDGRPPYVSLDP